MTQLGNETSGHQQTHDQKIIGLLFGGRSGEHDVSIRSAQAITSAFHLGDNPSNYTVRPFYIQRDGVWRSGERAQAVLSAGKAPDAPKTGQGDAPSKEEPGAIANGTVTPARWQFPADVADVDVWFPVLHGPNGEDG
ncbi:MAG: hypothetical protein F6K16_30355, partial [Symploca sp. SIO2B6]|nr:hypothetical protein [Symploca sp. SIO2B6]